MTQMVYTKDLKPLLDDRYIKNEATIIPNGSSSSSPNSLNNYMGLGFYYQSNPENIAELPESGKGFFLLVEDFGTKNYTKQTLTHTESNKTYTRIRNNGLWGSWREISANTTYNNVVANGTSGLMSGSDKAKLDSISYSQTVSLNPPNTYEIGKITVNNNTPTTIYGKDTTYNKGDGLLLNSNNVFSVDFGNSSNTDNTKVVACNDDRLKNTRTPTDNTVSTAKIQNYAVDFTKTQEFSADGGVSTAGYVKVMQITIGGAWKDMPIIFEIFSRSKGVSYVTLMFKNDAGNDPLVNVFTYTGAENEIYVVKNSTSKWDIVVKKPAHDKIVIKNLQQPHSYVAGGVTFAQLNTLLDSAPSLASPNKQATYIGFDGQEITDESPLDLNHANYQIPGVYYCSEKPTVHNMSHTPWQTAPPTASPAIGVGSPFSLVVLKNLGVTQILKPYGTSNKYIYVRNFYNGDWTTSSDSGNLGWYKLSIDGRDYATSNHNQASSTITDSTTYSHIGNSAQNQQSINSAINDKLGNKVTSISSSPTDEQYPSAKAVKAYVDNTIGTIDNWLVQ